jgi:hypothetical protein
MKSRSVILREIYAELKQSLPSEVSSKEIITLAQGLLNLYLKNQTVDDDTVDDFGFEDELEELAPCEWSVDLLMKNDTWDLSRYENDHEIFLEKLEQDDPELLDRVKAIMNMN